MSTSTVVVPSQAECDFFGRNMAQRGEIIEGLIREQQLVAFAGPYGVGKSPVLADVGLHVLTGSAWCGRTVVKRPIIHFDLETPGPVYKANLRNIAIRLNVSLPKVPDELDAYLEHDDLTEPGTEKLLVALESSLSARLELLEAALKKKPEALVLIDPLELLFRIDTGKKQHVLWLYTGLRRLLSRYQRAAILITFNLRKMDRRVPGRPDLLTAPREWLEEVCGTLDILNRSDVRLGMDFYGEDARIINGIRRGEEMHPLIIRPVEITPDTYAGFEACPPDAATSEILFTAKQRDYWDKLPIDFRFDEVADNVVPRATLFRLLKRAKSAGLVEEREGVWRKLAVPGVKL